MGSIWDKLKEAALQAGRAGTNDPRLVRAAKNLKETIDQFKQGYNERARPEEHKVICPHCRADLPPKARFCPNCGAKVDPKEPGE
jgi:rRNA maturation endonuclease Nob1